ncbi:cupin domain-containing protein [Aquimarina agarivorans]|uniref:cupin domain-containing protein n=1 Tax=Aquimarina agarivorans TaxID=980584 RepID=UPI000248EA14|nr:cupin domain-containing protein [Aquimarina agarivorans]
MKQQLFYNPINKESIRILKNAVEAGAERIVIEVKLGPNGGNPIHYHKKITEHFFPLEGTLGLHFNGKEVNLNPGEDLAVLPYDNHRFYNPSKAEFISFKVIITPPIESFEWFLKAQFGLVNDGRVFSALQLPKNPLHLLVLLKWGDTQTKSIFYSLAQPLLKLGYIIAKIFGVERKLKLRHC